MSDLAWMRPKLAELRGYLVYGDEDSYLVHADSKLPSNEHKLYWRPDEDVAQAIRCLEAAQDSHTTLCITKGHQWNVYIDGGMRYGGERQDKSLPRAICLAIAAALEWKNEQ